MRNMGQWVNVLGNVKLKLQIQKNCNAKRKRGFSMRCDAGKSKKYVPPRVFCDFCGSESRNVYLMVNAVTCRYSESVRAPRTLQENLHREFFLR